MYKWKLAIAFTSFVTFLFVFLQVSSLTSNKYHNVKPMRDLAYEGSFMNPTTHTTFTKNSAFDLFYQKLKPNFTYLLQPQNGADIFNSKCLKTKDAKTQMVLFVKSAARNAIRRELLRRTWGSICSINDSRIKTIFVIGDAQGMRNILLEEEHDRYGDLLQYNGSDNYQNIPLKTLAGMQWAADNLQETTFYSSVDDDFMINVAELMESVHKNIKRANESNWPEFPIICGFKKGSAEKPMRGKQWKWYISPDLYKWPDYPPYCHGGLYTTSVGVIKQLYRISRFERTLPLDDVWITGILRNKLGMPDSMVVVPRRPTGLHYNGYNGKGKESLREFMKQEWDGVFGLFRNKSVICKCES